MSLNRRLRAIEQLLTPDEPCPACGLGGTPAGEPEEFEVILEDLDGDDNQHSSEPEFCEECGRQTQYVITWMDLNDEQPGEAVANAPLRRF